MNADLEAQLKEMGPEYRAVVARLRAGKSLELAGRRLELRGLGRRSRSTAEWLIAASILIVFAFSLHLSSPLLTSPHFSSPPLTSIPHEYRLSPAEMIASQNADGSWQNDFLTRRNAEILAKCEGVEARIAYKKAMRNLRAKGML